MSWNDAARFTTPISPEATQRLGECRPVEPLSPESIASPSPQPKYYHFEWAPDPYDPTKHLGPPEAAVRCRLFTVEFRILSAEYFRPAVSFYARTHPEFRSACRLVTERVEVNEWRRVVMYIPHEGVYGIQVIITPDRPRFHVGHLRHRYLTTVYNESEAARVPLGAFEHRAVFGGEQAEQVDQGDQGDQEMMEIAAELNGQSTLEDIQSEEDTDYQKMDELFDEWVTYDPDL